LSIAPSRSISGQSFNFPAPFGARKSIIEVLKMVGSRFNWPLLALATGAFAIGVTEFAPMGMLPVIAAGVDVSIPSAGLLVSAYAVGVMIGAPL
jgi:hypothetical protein